jgi:DNA-3-methyladenine glycosylase II
MITKNEIKHLKKDFILKQVIENSDFEIKPSLELDIYTFLLRSIVSQQLSIKVAKVIFNRFLNLFPDRYPNNDLLLKMDDSILRNVGISFRKISYLKNVAEFSKNNNLDFEYIQQKTDDELTKIFTQIKGVGKWTVQMMLMFPLNRPDVFPVDDLGIQTKIKYLYNITSKNKEMKTDLEEIAGNWKPYRTLACKYLWNYKI